MVQSYLCGEQYEHICYEHYIQDTLSPLDTRIKPQDIGTKATEHSPISPKLDLHLKFDGITTSLAIKLLITTLLEEIGINLISLLPPGKVVVRSLSIMPSAPRFKVSRTGEHDLPSTPTNIINMSAMGQIFSTHSDSVTSSPRTNPRPSQNRMLLTSSSMSHGYPGIVPEQSATFIQGPPSSKENTTPLKKDSKPARFRPLSQLRSQTAFTQDISKSHGVILDCYLASAIQKTSLS